MQRGDPGKKSKTGQPAAGAAPVVAPAAVAVAGAGAAAGAAPVVAPAAVADAHPDPTEEVRERHCRVFCLFVRFFHV